MLKIGKDFAISSDEECVTIHRVRTAQSGKNKGKEYTSPRWYFPNFEQAFESLLEKEIMTSEIENFQEALLEAKKEVLDALNSVQGKKLVKVQEKPKEKKKEKVVMKCTKHPKYQGMRVPRSGCETCMKIYKHNKGE